MSLNEVNDRNRFRTLLERLVCDELELMESCQLAASQASGEWRGRLLHQAGLCQVHLFDLESSLLELAGRPASYSTCVRRSLGLGRRSFSGSLGKLLDRYQRTLAQRLPEDLRALLEANQNGHQQLAWAGQLLFAERQQVSA